MDNMDRLLIANFFNDGGWVLDFNSQNLSNFSLTSIGIDIKDPDLSKGKSLNYFLQNASANKVLKLTRDLIKYFDNIYEDRKAYLASEDRQRKYKKITKIIKKYPFNESLFDKFDEQQLLNDTYFKKITNAMIKQADSYPADSIGKAKDLLEAVFKRILEVLNIKYNKNDNFGQLSNKVMQALNLKPKSKTINPSIDNLSSKILGNFDQVAIIMNLLRNYYVKIGRANV